MATNDATNILLKPGEDSLLVDAKKLPDNQVNRQNDVIADENYKQNDIDDLATKQTQINPCLAHSSLEITRISQGLSGVSEDVKSSDGETNISLPLANKPASLQPTQEPKIGDVLKSKYRLEEKLGQGGMGSVFKAVDLVKVEVRAKNPYVVVKILLPSFSQDIDIVTGFHREAEKSQKLTHKNIIKVFDADREGNLHFIVMEYLQGEPLNQYIRLNSPVSLTKAWPLIKGMGLGLAHAHEQNIIHRDFKPANVFVLEGTNEIKILDFGIASELRKADANPNDQTIFKPDLCYTPAYASFETIYAFNPNPRDDIFSFGLVVYELLTGKHPYDRKQASDISLEQLNGSFKQPIQPSELSSKQWQLLSQAIAIKREQRPGNLYQWLTEFESEVITRRSYPRPFILAISASILVLIIVAGYFWQNKSTPSKSEIPVEVAVNQPEAISSPPMAKAGNDQQIILGQSVSLDGNASQSSDSSPLSYAWRLLQKPEHSNSELAGANTAIPQLHPDQPGQYKVELTVTNTHNQISTPDTLEINVKAPPIHLNLATSQKSYRIGDYLKVTLKPSEEGYLGVLYLSGTGEKSQIYPVFDDKEAHVKADVTYQIPPKNKPKMLKIEGPVGTDTIIAVFSKEPLPELANYVDDKGEMSGLGSQVVVEKWPYQVTEN